MIPVRIFAIRQETPTIKSFTLDLGGQDFTFLPGQWIDCYVEIDRDIKVAGYSMTSSPLTTDTIDLAVKSEGRNPVTRFLHERAQVDDELYIDGGFGEFCYRRDMGDSLVIVGGGIGLTPLMSIMRYVDEAQPDVRATLVYSAESPSELLFRDQLEEMAARNSRIRCLFTVTGPPSEAWDGRVGRIDAAMLAEANLDPGALFFLCGPPAMVQDMARLIEDMGVPAARVIYEAW